jgi:hypothetical protein
MKKNIYFLFFLLLIGTGTYSQISLRPQLGVNFGSLDYKSVHGSVKAKTGFHFGADLQLGGTIYIQPGLNISTNKLQVEDFGDIDITEMNIPILLGLKFMQSGSKAFGLRAFVGPNFSFNIKETIDEKFTDISKDDLKNFQLSGIVGGGLDFSILFVDIGYKFGLTKYIETEDADQSIDYFIGNVGLRIGF